MDTLTIHTGSRLPAAGERIFISAGEFPPGCSLHGIGFEAGLPVGTLLGLEKDRPMFRILACGRQPGSDHTPVCGVWAEVLAPIESAAKDSGTSGRMELTAWKTGLSAARITLSDKGSQGLREDTAGPALESALRKGMDICFSQSFILPDELRPLKALLTDLCLVQRFDLIFTAGGTGVGPRDITPEATLAVIEKRLHGFERAMTAASLQKTPHAVISRAVTGTLGNSLILNLPGSTKAVLENLAAVLPALPHTVEKLQGCTTDCAHSVG